MFEQLRAFALDLGGSTLEDPTDLEIVVVDQNDNRPAFLQEAFTGHVLEGAAPGETGRRPRAGRGCREGLCEARNPGCPSSKNFRGPSESLKISKQVSEEGPFPQVDSSHFPFQYKFQTQKSAPGSGGFSGVLFSPKANDFSLLLRGHLEPSTPHAHPALRQGPKHPQASLGCDSPQTRVGLQAPVTGSFPPPWGPVVKTWRKDTGPLVSGATRDCGQAWPRLRLGGS